MDWTKQTPLKVGLHPPEQCARRRTDCRSLAQIVSSDAETFMCCGEIAPEVETPDPRDRWALCVRGCQFRQNCIGTDTRIFIDQHDMRDMAAVLSMGLAVSADRT